MSKKNDPMNNHFTPLNELILALYRGASSIASVDFNTWALEQLQQHLSFDCAWWGQVVTEPEPTVLAAHLFNADPQLLGDYQAIADNDTFAMALTAQPGQTIIMTDLMSPEALYQSDMWRLYGDKHQVHACIGTLLLESRIHTSEFLTLWRTDRRWPFSESDRQFKQLVMPHMVEARRLSRLLSIKSSHERSDNKNWAICNSLGFLQEFGSGFTEAMLAEWPQWESAQLPPPLVTSLKHSRPYLGQHIVVEFESFGDRALVQTRSRDQVDHLSAREQEIAALYASGQSSPEIAIALGSAQGTVRKHIQRIYAKLNVSTKIDLSKKLRDQ